MREERERNRKRDRESVDITQKVSDAIASGNFSDLNSMVKDTVKDTVEEVVDEIKRISNRPRTRYSSSGMHSRHGAFSPNDRYTGYGNGYGQKLADRAEDFVNAGIDKGRQILDGINTRVQNPNFRRNDWNVQRQAPVVTGVRFVPRKNVSSVIISIISWFFGVSFLIAFLGTLPFIGGYGAPVASITMGLFLLPCIFGIVASSRNLRNLSKAKRLYHFVRERNYITISEIAGIFQCQEIEARKMMLRILEQGIFPDARFDVSGTTLLLTRQAYENYTYIEKRKQTVQLEDEKEQQKLTGSDAAKELSPEQRTAWLNVVNDGENYIRRLRQLNDEIPDEITSNKLDELEKLLREIFDRVKVKPSEASQMQRFMDYYLPTTVKLVEKYKEFNQISVPNKEVLDAKSDIENTIDTINQAFVEMLNNLYKNDIYDVTTDASVIKTMLAKEGLTKDFRQ